MRNGFLLPIESSMAPTLTSNSFLLAVAPHSRLGLRHQRVAVITKKAATFAKATDEGKSGGNSSPFRFDFGKLGDVKSLVPVVPNPSSGLSFGRRKDPSTVFVAGATGQAGIRIAQTLLRQGFSVRAGVPDLAAAQELALLAAKYKIISNEESKRLNAVNSTFNDVETIAKAIGNASKVVVTISPAENGPAAEVTISDALRVIQAAQLANVGHIAIVYDGTSRSSSTYNVLDGITSFFNNLFSRSQPLSVPEFLQKVVEADIGYTLIRTSLTDDFSPERSYNVVVSNEGSAGADYKVTKSQVAALVADVLSNVAVAENKVLQVSTDPTAPSKPISDVLREIPEDKRREFYTKSLAKAKALEEEEAKKASEQASKAEAAARKEEQEAKKQEQEDARAAQLSAEAQKKVEAAAVENMFNKAKGMALGFSWDNLSSQLKSSVQKPEEVPQVQVEEPKEPKGKSSGFPWDKFSAQLKSTVQKPKEEPQVQVEEAKGKSSGFPWDKFSRQLKSTVQKPEEEPKVQVAMVRGQARARTLPSQKAVVKNQARGPPPSKSRIAPKLKAKPTETKTETRKLFGGLFQQETIYIDDE